MKKENTNTSKNPDTLPEGFYYAREDYAGLFKRLIIIFIDLIVIYFLSTIVIVLFSMFPENIEDLISANIPVVIFVSYLYLTLMKRSWGTVGYWITGVKIVDLEGEEPSMWLMTLRYFMLVLGPINLIIDIIWLTSDENRQTLRDKIAETYVIRRDAMPLGYGQQKITPYFIAGYSFTFKEVKRPAEG